jgi:hypothetical protein
MADYVTIGLASIQVSAIASDGDVGTSFAAIGKTDEGSATITTADATFTEFYAEEVAAPIYTAVKEGSMEVKFNLAAPDLPQLAAVFGGSVTGTGGSATWEMPDITTGIEKSLKITPTAGFILTFPRASITAKLIGGLKKTDTLKVEVTAKILQPTKAGVKRLKTSLLA